MFNLGKSKQKDTEAQKLLNRNLTANQFINVKDIDGNFVYTKDGRIFCYIKISPLSLELMSEQEQRLRGKMFTAEFSAIKHPYKFLSLSRPVDISFMIDNYTKKLNETDNMKRREILSNKISEVNTFAINGEIIEHQYFMVLSVTNKKDGQRELLKMANEAISHFKACRMDVSLCKQNEIIKLFNLFANPNYAHLEDEDIGEYIPFVN